MATTPANLERMARHRCRRRWTRAQDGHHSCRGRLALAPVAALTAGRGSTNFPWSWLAGRGGTSAADLDVVSVNQRAQRCLELVVHAAAIVRCHHCWRRDLHIHVQRRSPGPFRVGVRLLNEPSELSGCWCFPAKRSTTRASSSPRLPGATGRQPSSLLACDLHDTIKVAVVVHECELVTLRDRGDEEIGDSD